MNFSKLFFSYLLDFFYHLIWKNETWVCTLDVDLSHKENKTSEKIFIQIVHLLLHCVYIYR